MTEEKVQIDLEEKIEELEKKMAEMQVDRDDFYRYWKCEEMKVTVLKVLCLADLKSYMSKDELVEKVLDTIQLMKP